MTFNMDDRPIVQTAPKRSSERQEALWSFHFSLLLFLGGLLRLVLILYGVHHDASHALKYTDIDYYVFSDASSFLLHPSNHASGPLSRYLGLKIGTPYDRATYRYTPILAILLTGNHTLHHTYGKFIFCTSDLVIAALLYLILVKQQRLPQTKANLYISMCWLFNPFVANISSRGSSEALLGVFILLSLFYANQGKWDMAAVMFGFCVHFKIYPFIYASAVLAKLHRYGSLINLQQIRFGIISFSSFMTLNGAMFAIWGEPFLQETYLYHLSRLDHRHNFSQHFYQIYLALSRPEAQDGDGSAFSRIATFSFIPQLGLCLLIGFLLGNKRNLSYTWFVQTLAFTTFNRYFMWYLWFLPPLLATGKLSNRRGLMVLIAWVAGQVLWLSIAYQLEFEGRPVFLELWGASSAFFVVNVCIIWTILSF